MKTLLSVNGAIRRRPRCAPDEADGGALPNQVGGRRNRPLVAAFLSETGGQGRTERSRSWQPGAAAQIRRREISRYPAKSSPRRHWCATLFGASPAGDRGTEPALQDTPSAPGQSARTGSERTHTGRRTGERDGEP